MRLYVRTLEEEVPDWWAQHQASGVGAPTANGTAEGAPAAAAGEAPPAAPPAPAAAGGGRPAPKSRSVTEVVVEGSWVSPYISDRRPPPRYEHATALIGSELFIVGGNYGAPAFGAFFHPATLAPLPPPPPRVAAARVRTPLPAVQLPLPPPCRPPALPLPVLMP